MWLYHLIAVMYVPSIALFRVNKHYTICSIFNLDSDGRDKYKGQKTNVLYQASFYLASYIPKVKCEWFIYLTQLYVPLLVKAFL